MSIGHRCRVRRYRRCSDSAWLPRCWALWQVRRRVLGYVLAVDVFAVAVVVVTVWVVPVGLVDVGRWALLLTGSVIHVEATRGIERLRVVTAGDGPYLTAKGLWTFAAVLVLPPPLTAVLIAVT